MNIAIIGSGTWGTALGQVLIDNGHKVIIYGNCEDQIIAINENHKISFYFGYKIELPLTLKATLDIEEAITPSDVIVLSVPTVALRSVLKQMKPYLGTKKRIFINTAKGFEMESNSKVYYNIPPLDEKRPNPDQLLPLLEKLGLLDSYTSNSDK